MSTTSSEDSDSDSDFPSDNKSAAEILFRTAANFPVGDMNGERLIQLAIYHSNMAILSALETIQEQLDSK